MRIIFSCSSVSFTVTQQEQITFVIDGGREESREKLTPQSKHRESKQTPYPAGLGFFHLDPPLSPSPHTPPPNPQHTGSGLFSVVCWLEVRSGTGVPDRR